MQFPPIGGGEAATWGGVAPTVQTTSAKNGENGRLWARSWQLGPSTGSLNPSMRSYTHLVEAGRRRPRSTRWVNMRIKGPKHPPAGPRPPPIELTCASKGFTCAGCVHRNRRGPDSSQASRRLPHLQGCDGGGTPKDPAAGAAPSALKSHPFSNTQCAISLSVTTADAIKNRHPKSDVDIFCGARGIRTPDLFHAMEARYQLRHSPVI